MEVHLMFREKEFDCTAPLCFQNNTLTADLELQRILDQMAQNDRTVLNTCRSALFQPLQSADRICYRQEAMKDAVRNPDTVKELYRITADTQEKRQGLWGWLSPDNSLSSNFTDAAEILRLYLGSLMQLRETADRKGRDFRSDAFRNLFSLFQEELTDSYFEDVRTLLKELQATDELLISAELGPDLAGVSYVLRSKQQKGFLWHWKLAPSFSLAPRDDAGAKDLEKRKDRALNEATNALAQAAEHIEGFFASLRRELAFYIGGIHLADLLRRLNLPICFPDLLQAEEYSRSFVGLYDISLALEKNRAVTGNSLQTDKKRLYLITGANQGGKTTFLRSIGQAQLMAQCGLFVGASGGSFPIRRNILTHFKKEEDPSMKSGKLDEELCRMDGLAEHLQKGSLILFNESFAATNERDGSEMNRQIIKALTESGVEVFSVTHLYAFAVSFLHQPSVQYLRAERLENGRRTFQLVPKEPCRTAYGEDLYREIFSDSPDAS